MAGVGVIKFTDKVFGSLLAFILSLFSGKKEIEPDKAKKILFIQLWSIGETILTLPAVLSVKNTYKNTGIYVLATKRNRDVYLSAMPEINIITLRLNPLSIILAIFHNFRKFDLVIDLEEYLNASAVMSFFLGKQRVGFSTGIRSKLYNSAKDYDGQQHVVDTFLGLVKIIDVKPVNSLPRLSYNKEIEEKIQAIMRKIPKNAKAIAIAAGAAESAKSRMWPANKFAELSKQLLEKLGCFLIFLGSEKEKSLVNDIIKKIDKTNKTINTAGRISVAELFCLIDKVDLLIANDTGPVHIASAQKTKAIALFGPNLPKRFGPYQNYSISIYHPEACGYSPCINVHLGKVPDCLYPENSKDYQKCMKSIQVKEVFKAVEKVI
ncbi:hypothetical protein GF323_04295 [Candidatus Woesearchaeota archaeon]|nr:hypothetical protein [Candidatus Woesearchaeota archaeon]